MGKLVSVVGGAIAGFIGIILLLAWRYELMVIFKGVLPVMLITGGVIAVMSGFSEFKDLLKSKGR